MIFQSIGPPKIPNSWKIPQERNDSINGSIYMTNQLAKRLLQYITKYSPQCPDSV